jgi:hypothetical protein
MPPTLQIQRRPAVARHRFSYRPRVEGLEQRCVPTTVMNLNDAGPGSLRQAILDTAAGGTVDFQPGLTGTITLSSGELELHQSVTIQGPGAATLAVSGNDASRVFEIFGGAIVTVADLTITHGQVFDTGTGTLSALGGGIYVNSGATLTVRGAILSNNMARAITSGGVVGSATAEGGAIFCAGDLTVNNATITGNAVSASGTGMGLGNASGYGGGIYYSASRTLAVSNSTFSSNSATASGTGRGNITSAGGGSVYNGSGTLTIDTCALNSNTATSGSTAMPGGTTYGGAIYSGGPLTVTGSMVTDNSVSGGGPPL